MCSLQQTPIFINGNFPNFIEQKTKKNAFLVKNKNLKKNFFFGDRGPVYLDFKVGKIQKSALLISAVFGLNIVNMVFFPNNSSF